MPNPKTVASASSSAALTSSVSNNSFFRAFVPGLFRISYYVAASFPTGSGTFDLDITWTDPNTSQSNSITLNPSSYTNGEFIIDAIANSMVGFSINVSGFTPNFYYAISIERITGEF